MTSTAAGVRAEARDAMMRAILSAAKAQLREVGADGLSVRAVAREVGMASSAIYRYVASRDELLTALLIDGYDELGAAVEAAEAAVDRSDIEGRFRACCEAVRRWAQESPQSYALLYGSPVPGYVAPEATIGPATRVPIALSSILVDAEPSRQAPVAFEIDPRRAGLEIEAVRAVLPGVPPSTWFLAISTWVQLFGLVSFELFGHLVGSVAECDAFFEASVDEVLVRLGLVRTGGTDRSHTTD